MIRHSAALAATVLLAACGSGGEEAQAAENADAGSDAPRAAEAPMDDLPDLAPVLDFANARDCEWSEAAEGIFEGATVFGDDYVSRPGTVSIPGIAEPVTARLDRPMAEAPDVVSVELDFEGRWLGLPVTGLADSFIEEGDGLWGRAVRFDAPVAEVAAALADAGFDVAPDGSERQRVIADEGGDRVLMVSSIEEEDGESVFYCNQPYLFEGQEYISR